MPNLIERIDQYNAEGHDCNVDAVALSVIREVNRKVTPGMTLGMEQLKQIGGYAKWQAHKLTIDQQKQVVESVLKAVMNL